jgi:hypothetical protein
MPLMEPEIHQELYDSDINFTKLIILLQNAKSAAMMFVNGSA